ASVNGVVYKRNRIKAKYAPQYSSIANSKAIQLGACNDRFPWPALPLKLAEQHHAGRAIEASAYTTNSYNMCYIVTVHDGYRVLVRFPALSRSRFRYEKTSDKLLVMGFLTRNTQIPMPTVLGTGFWAGGPYIITTVIEGSVFSRCLGDLAVQSPSLNPQVSDRDLTRAYRGMAQIMLEISKPAFKYIRALH
ncbi:hypothetical protein AJ79_09544, partial [Helicocarpus griseus UAMH5409]